MEGNFKANLNNFFNTHIKDRKAMFIPIASVATFMLVGYAAVDKEAPKIESETVEVAYGTTFNTDSVSVNDNRDQASAISLKADTSSLNMKQLGTYQVKVSATDTSNNTTTKTVTVKVVDKEGPKFETLGQSQGYVVSVPLGGSNDIASYIKATDNVDGDVTAFIKASSQLDTSKVGTQTITLTATDSSGNTTAVTYDFSVTDTEAPVINLTKGNTVEVEAKTTFDINQYVTVTDNSGNLTPEVEGTVDTSKLGTYTLTIKAKDASGNEAASQVLTVNVVDKTAPGIDLKAVSKTIYVGETVNFASYLSGAIDTNDGDVTSKVSIPANFTATSAGTTTHTFTVTDAAGNTATVNFKVTAVNRVTTTRSSSTTTTTTYVPTNYSGSSIVSIAYSKLGSRYVYGASGPNVFDCSGFTSWVYRQVGKSIPRTSGGQRSGGTRLSYSQMQPGDIVCFSGHVGIYVGNGMMIHAPTTGDVVKVSSIAAHGGFICGVRY